MSRLTAIALALTAVSANAQTLMPVTNDDHSGLVLLVGGVILAVGVIVLRLKRPDLWSKITKQAGPAIKDVEHTIGGLASKVPNVASGVNQAISQAETKLHAFTEHAPIQAPAISPTPTSAAMQYAASAAALEPVPGVPPLTTDQFMGDAPIPAAPAPQPAAGPRIVNGRMVP
jgi:hypothetical protein